MRPMAARATLANTGTQLVANHGRVAPIALFLGALLLYLRTLTQVHTFDALSYVTSVERKPWTEVFHPHHLAYGPLGALALAFGRAVGYTGGAALPMQLVNAVAGALGVALFFALVRRVTGRGDVALITALLLGGAYAYWYYAVEIEVYTVATLFLIGCLSIMSQPQTWTSRRRLLLLGLTQGGAVLFHQTNVLLCVPVLVYALYDLRFAIYDLPMAKACTSGSHKDKGRSRFALQAPGLGGWILRWSTYAVPFIVTVFAPYLYVGIVISRFRTWSAFEAWLTEYARTGWWGGPITAQKWADLGKGLADTLAQPGGALLWLLLIGLMLVYLRRLTQMPRPLVAVLLTWLIVYSAFFFWWEPDNIEFWIASLPPA